MDVPKQPKIAIVGGSLVGPACELFLRRQGFTDVTTYEALPAAHSQSGGVMGMHPQVLTLLKSIGVCRQPITALRDFHTYTYDLDGESVTQRDMSRVPGVVVSWQSLHDAFRSLVHVHTRKRVTSLTELGAGWLLDFADGTSAEADLVIGADGRSSFLRTLLCPERPMTYNGYTVWRGLTEPVTPASRGWERYFDIRHGRMLAITEPIIQTGLSYWELIANTTAEQYESVSGGSPTKRGFMLPGMGDPVALARVVGQAAHRLPDRFRAAIVGSDIAGIPVNDVPMATRAVFGRPGGPTALLVGDALQTIRSQAGAGLNQGLRQVAELADSLRAGDLGGWERRVLARLGPVIELGRSRAHRNNLGIYEPVRPGFTAAPGRGQWSDPRWVSA